MALSAALRDAFPIFDNYRQTFGADLVYLDSAATAQRPDVVLRRERDYALHSNAAAYRGSHRLGHASAAIIEDARATVARFVNVAAREIVFTRSATESLNLLAYCFGSEFVDADQRERFPAVGREHSIVVSEAEHHANILPWQRLASETGCELRWIACDADGRLQLDDAARVITDNTRVVAVTHLSNVTGHLTDVPRLTRMAHDVGAVVVLDASQSVGRMPVDLSRLGVDFAVFSGHKMLGPTGVGVLFGRSRLLYSLPPFLLGGGAVEDVSTSGVRLPQETPRRFEPGVPAAAQIAGLAEACRFLDALSMEQVCAHETELTRYAVASLSSIPGVRLVGGTALDDRLGMATFGVDEVHPHDLAEYLDGRHIAVRAGHHCARPLHRRLGADATLRASFSVYSRHSDVDRLAEAVASAADYFARWRA